MRKKNDLVELQRCTCLSFLSNLLQQGSVVGDRSVEVVSLGGDVGHTLVLAVDLLVHGHGASLESCQISTHSIQVLVNFVLMSIILCRVLKSISRTLAGTATTIVAVV